VQGEVSGQSRNDMQPDFVFANKLRCQGEVSGQSRNDMQSGELFALAAGTYQPNRRAVFDAGMRFGLNAAAPRFGVFAGMTFGIVDFTKHATLIEYNVVT
jgi:hypothetical protein